MDNQDKHHIGTIPKQQRINIPLTLQELAGEAEVSASHLCRIERGERFPSAHILRKIAAPMGFEENKLFTLAGYLSSQSTRTTDSIPSYGSGQWDSYVARVLSQEPPEVQHTVIVILTMRRSIAKSMDK